MQVCEGRHTLLGDGGVRADHASKHRRTTCFRGDARLPPLLNIKQADREINWTKEIINVSKIPNAKTWQGGLACVCLIDFLTRAIATWRHMAWTGHDMCHMDTCTMMSMFTNLPPVHNVAFLLLWWWSKSIGGCAHTPRSQGQGDSSLLLFTINLFESFFQATFMREIVDLLLFWKDYFRHQQ